MNKIELKKQLQRMGIKIIKGNFIRKRDILSAAGRVTCQKLADILLESKILPEKLAKLTPTELEKKLKDSCEAFGKDVRCFVRLDTMDKRKQLEQFLKTKGISPNPKYWPTAPVVDIPVSYFKAWHWDE